MLPFTKRPPRPGHQDPAELITTDEIEVVRTPGSGRKMQSRLPQTKSPPPSERPRVFQRSLSDEDQTLLMAQKPKISSNPPPPLPVSKSTPASVRPVPMPNLRGLVRPRVDEERTILRPSAPPSQPAPAPVSTAPAMLPTPYMPFKPPAAPLVPKFGNDVMTRTAPSAASSVMTPLPRRDSDPPAAVITARTKVGAAMKKPNISWAAALMAAGVFVGLVTAVLARGDGDALIDATAAFVDPSSHGTRAAATQTQAAQTATSDKSAKTAAIGTGACLDPMAAPITAPAAQPKEPLVASTKVVDETAGRPEAPKPSPVAFAAPATPAPAAAAPVLPAVHVASAAQHAPLSYNPGPAPAPPPPKPVQVAAVSHPQPAPQHASPAPAVAHGGSEMDNAAAADALAKAQLEASLR